MLISAMYVDNSENTSEHVSVSQAITWLSEEMDGGRGVLGEVRSLHETVCTVRRKEGITTIKIYDPCFFATELNLKLSTPMEFKGITTGTQTFATNMEIGESLKIGNVKQTIGIKQGANQKLLTDIQVNGDLEVGILSQEC